MKFLGVEFVPFNAPAKHLEVLAAGAIFVLLLGLPLIGIFLTTYLLFFTKYWVFVCIYLFWIWVIDKHTPEKGGRSNEWVRSWSLFKYVRNYFPITIKQVPDFKVDPNQNYISCSFPHGVMPIGIIVAFQTNAFEESKMWFPKHSLHALTLKCNFWIPLYREFLLAIGVCSVTPASIKWLLNYPGGGQIAGIAVGGAAESFNCLPGQYRLILKNRKGFIKMALKTGTSIIPTFSFGQNNSFRQVVFQERSVFRRLQILIKKLIGVAPILIYGRGLFQHTFGFIPLQKPINIVVGNPVDIPKIENPTQVDIDAVHKKFIENLNELFEEYKYEYEKNPEESQLIIS